MHFFKTWLLRSRSQWLKTVSDIQWPQHIFTNWIWGLICLIIWDMLLNLCFACCRWVVLSVNCFVPNTTVMLTVSYINRQLSRGYHYSNTNACSESAASKNPSDMFLYISFVRTHTKFGIKIFEIDFEIEIKWYLTFWLIPKAPGGGTKIFLCCALHSTK